MSVFGEKRQFAIETMRARIIHGKPRIHFRMWVDGQPLGDYAKEIDLIDCVTHLSDFVKLTNRRYKHGLENLSNEEVFEEVYSKILGERVEKLPRDYEAMELVDDAGLMNLGEEEGAPLFADFDDDPIDRSLEPSLPLTEDDYQRHCHMDRIGMEAFKGVVSIILLEKRNQMQRLYWREKGSPEIRAFELPPKYFEDVGRQFISWAELETGMKLKESWVRLWKG